jgi:putative SOS response-associated peptidase YedK
MCYYYGQKVTRAEFIRLKELEKEVMKYEFLNKDIHNGFAYKPVAVLKPKESKDNFDIVEMEWGMVPPYLKNRDAVEKFRNGYKDETGKWRIGYTTLNAMDQNLFTNDKGNKSMYADAARSRRCLVLSSGIYEWQHVPKKNKKTGAPLKTVDKYPYHITVKDSPYFYMAGLWQSWTDKETGEYVETVTIVTTKANHLMEQVHNVKKRMPTILDEDLGWEWIMGDLSDERIMEIASTQYPSELMDACTVAKDFLASLDPATPFVYEDLPALELSIHG